MSGKWLQEQQAMAASRPYAHMRYDDRLMGWVSVTRPNEPSAKLLLQSLPTAQEYEERVESERIIRDLQQKLKIETDVVLVRHEVSEQMQQGTALSGEHRIFLRRNIYENSATRRVLKELLDKGWKVKEDITSFLEWTIKPKL